MLNGLLIQEFFCLCQPSHPLDTLYFHMHILHLYLSMLYILFSCVSTYRNLGRSPSNCWDVVMLKLFLGMAFMVSLTPCLTTPDVAGCHWIFFLGLQWLYICYFMPGIYLLMFFFHVLNMLIRSCIISVFKHSAVQFTCSLRTYYSKFQEVV